MARPNPSISVESVLGPNGPVARELSGYEMRPQQVQMACAIREAFTKGRHLAVEAGTGVGKSFAYLVPLIQQINATGEKGLVSTFTITLQEQLVNKDLPLLARCLPKSFRAVLAKGRGNYLCKRRLGFALRTQRWLFGPAGEELNRLRDWASRTKDGSRSDLPFLPDTRTWDAVQSEHSNCTGRQCPHVQDCFYRVARKAWKDANLIVANHALLFSDLVLKEQGVGFLPVYRYVVVDEAHNIERAAEEHFGINVSNHQIKYLLDGLYNVRARKGLLAHCGNADAIELVERTGKESAAFFRRIRAWYEENKAKTNGRCTQAFVDDTLSPYLQDLRRALDGLAGGADDEDEKFELVRAGNQCLGLSQEMGTFLSQGQAEQVYWVEAGEKGRASVHLRAAPINVGPDVRRHLFDPYEPVILTSATLSTGSGKAADFEFFAGRIGLTDFDGLRLDSPFDYKKQVTLYVEKDLPSPNTPEFLAAASETLKKYLLQTAGRAFVLFTSYRMLDDLAESLRDWLADNRLKLLQQGAEFDRRVLLEHFKTKGGSVLFGTDSFWQGVDVPGEALSNVIIVRLPFAVPDQPLLAGRLEQIREQGGEPFMEYQLPSAILKFKQGFGRLIRTKTDTGIVVVLDSRIVTRPYGRQFLAAIPPCTVRVVTSKPAHKPLPSQRTLPEADSAKMTG
jgi:ATP-dependent DNA helicase DinG